MAAVPVRANVGTGGYPAMPGYLLPGGRGTAVPGGGWVEGVLRAGPALLASGLDGFQAADAFRAAPVLTGELTFLQVYQS